MTNELLYGAPEEQKKDFYFFRANNSRGMYDYMYKHGATEDAEIDSKYKNVLINIELPQLEGTAKQISYAEDLRVRMLFQLISHIDGIMPQPKKMDEMFANLSKAGYKAETKSDVYNILLKEQQAFDTNDLFTETSAKNIIEKYKHASLQQLVKR